MRTRRRYVLTAVALLVTAITLGSLGASTQIEQALVPAATWVPQTPAGNCTAECQAFVDEVGPSLRSLVAEGMALAELGQTRSRNIVELTVRMDRFKESGSEFERLIDDRTVPENLETRVIEIQTTITLANQAIDDSIASIRSFDWESLGVHVDTFSAQVETLSGLVSGLKA